MYENLTETHYSYSQRMQIPWEMNRKTMLGLFQQWILWCLQQWSLDCCILIPAWNKLTHVSMESLVLYNVPWNLCRVRPLYLAVSSAQSVGDLRCNRKTLVLIQSLGGQICWFQQSSCTQTLCVWVCYWIPLTLFTAQGFGGFHCLLWLKERNEG